MLQFLDDGHGMDSKECGIALNFGITNKNEMKNKEYIGKYGNGFKKFYVRKKILDYKI
jgi:hypothetical protein